jgi:hypothetical protein
MDDLRRALEWESRGYGWLRAELARWRDHTEAIAPAVRAMRLTGWPEHTHLLIDYLFRGQATTKDMDLWYGDYLNPPRGDRAGDDQMIATIGWSEFLEDVACGRRADASDDISRPGLGAQCAGDGARAGQARGLVRSLEDVRPDHGRQRLASRDRTVRRG